MNLLEKAIELLEENDFLSFFNLIDFFNSSLNNKKHLLNKLKFSYYTIQDNELELFNKCKTFAQSFFSEKNISYLTTLGFLYEREKEYLIAEFYYTKVLVLLENSVGKKHIEYIVASKRLNRVYRLLEKYKSKEIQFNPEKTGHHNSLNYIVEKAKKIESTYQEIISIRSIILHEENPPLSSILDLANLYTKVGKYKEARFLYNNLLEVQNKELGKEHPDYLKTLNNLKKLSNKQGKHINIESSKVLSKVEVIEEGHPDYIFTVKRRASSYFEKGQYKQAQTLYEKIFSTQQKEVGEEHPDYMKSLNNLAKVYYRQKS